MISHLRPTRPWHGASSLTTLAWALSLLLLPPMACSGTAAPGGTEEVPAAQRDLLEMLPASAHAVAFVDIDAVRGSALFDLTVGDEGMVTDSDDLREFIERTGIDPRRDIHRLAFVSLSDGTDLDGTVVLAETTFDRAEMETTLADLPAEEWSGRTVYSLGSFQTEHPAEDEGPGREDQGEERDSGDEPDLEVDSMSGHLVILEDDLLAVGSAAGVRAVLDVIDGAAAVRSNERLAALIRDVQPDEAEAWVVTAQDEILSRVESPQGIPVDKIHSFLLSVNLDEGIALSLRGRTGSEEDAELLGESLRGMLAFGKMMLQNDHPAIFDIVDRGIRAGSSGYDVTIKASLSSEDLETLRRFAREQFDVGRERDAVEG